MLNKENNVLVNSKTAHATAWSLTRVKCPGVGRYKTQVTGHRAQVTGHRLQGTGYRKFNKKVTLHGLLSLLMFIIIHLFYLTMR